MESEKITKIEVNMAKIETKLNSIDKKLDDFISCAEQRFAPRWVEWAVKLMVSGMILGTIGIVFWLVEK